MNNRTQHAGIPYLGPKQYPLFRLYGFEVKIDLSWLLLALLITWTLAAGLFPNNYPELAGTTYWWMGLGAALGVFFSIVFHEFAHSMVARHYGMPIHGITLFIFGGVAEMEDEPPSPGSEFWVAIAGPISSFVLALFFYFVHTIASAANVHTSILGVSDYLSQINMIIAIFNLVPAFPLDGGRILRAGLWKWKNNLVSATRISSRIGSMFGLVLIILGVMGFIQGNFIGGMWWLLIGTFLRGAADASYKQLIVREILLGTPIKNFMDVAPVVVSPSASIQQLVGEYMYKYHLDMLPVLEGSKLLGCITTEVVKAIPRQEWDWRLVGESIIPSSPENSVSPEVDASQVMRSLLFLSAKTRLMVVEDGRLLGVVSRNNLSDYLALKLDLET